MEKFFQRYGWVINFAIIGLVTLMMALLVNGFVAAQLAKFTVPEMPSFDDVGGPDTVAADDVDRDGWVTELQRRCLFGCPEEEVDPDECPEGCPDGEICEEGECVAEEPEEDLPDFDVPQETELPVKLTGVLAAQNPRWSMAMIRDEEGGDTYALGVGDAVPSDDPIEILEIRRDRVFIDHDGQLEFIRLEDSPYGDPEPIDPRQQRGRSGGDDSGDDRSSGRRQRRQEDDGGRGGEEESAVVRRSEGEYAVDRERLESQVSNPEQLREEARIMPNYTDGEPDGLRLVGVTPDSLYSDMGIQSGDVLHNVDGQPVSNQREAMRMLEAMENEDEVVIEIERRGQRQEKTYTIR